MTEFNFESSESSGILSGVVVADFTMGWAGPLLTQTLADFGADVVKVESITHADWWRSSLSLFGVDSAGVDRPWERSPLFNSVNENKRGITIDMNSDSGRELARDLIARSDVLVENFTPRVMANFGLDYPAVREISPAIVMVSMPAFGREGPWADNKATAFITESHAGISAHCGYAGEEPSLLSCAYADPSSGIVGAMTVAMALRHRRRTGEGQHIEVAQIEALTPHIGPALLGTQMNGPTEQRHGNSSPIYAPHGCYPAAGEDSWVTMAIQTNDQWLRFARNAHTTLLLDPKWNDTDVRLAHRAELDAAVSEWTTSRNAHAIADSLQQLGIPAGPVLSPSDLLDDPHLRARGFFRMVERAVVGAHPYPSPPMTLSRTPWTRRSAAPTLGQHNGEVLREVLGLTADEITDLESRAVIGDHPRHD